MSRLGRFVNQSFDRRISFYFVPLIAGLSIVVAILSYSIFFKAFRQEKEQAAALLVRQIGVNFDYYFRDAKTIIAYLYNNGAVQRAYRYYQDLTFEQKTFLNFDIDEFTKNVNIFKNYMKDVMFLGENGFQRNLPTYYRLSYERAIIASDWLQPYRHLTEHRIYFTAPHMNDYYETGASPSLVVSAILPVFAEGRRLGFVIGDIDYPMLSSVLDEIYRQNAINISMVSDTGLYVFHRDGRQVNAKVDPGLLSQMRGEEGEFPYASPSGRQLCVYQKSTVTGWYLLASIPYSSILRPSANVARIILFLIMPFSLCCAVGLTVLLSRRIRRPLARLVRRIEQVDIEHFEPMSLPDEVGEIANLRHKFEEMLQRINQLVVQSYRLEIQQRDAQFEALRSQITPHFMYNALQLIKTEAVVAGNNEISGIVTSFGNLLRYASETTPSLVSVEEELDYIRDYLAIYQRRFGRRFDYRIESDPKILRLAILKLVLQPLVENSIMHGLKEAKADGRIEIEARRDAECVSFSVADNGRGIPEEKLRRILSELDTGSHENGRIGLYNVHQRARIKYGPGYGIVAIESRPGRTVVRLRLKGERKDAEGHPD